MLDRVIKASQDESNVDRSQLALDLLSGLSLGFPRFQEQLLHTPGLLETILDAANNGTAAKTKAAGALELLSRIAEAPANQRELYAHPRVVSVLTDVVANSRTSLKAKESAARVLLLLAFADENKVPRASDDRLRRLLRVAAELASTQPQVSFPLMCLALERGHLRTSDSMNPSATMACRTPIPSVLALHTPLKRCVAGSTGASGSLSILT